MSQTLAKLGGDLAAIRPRPHVGGRSGCGHQACTQVPEALDRLTAGGFLVEATRLVAHALPKREAVWWACMCAVHTAPADLPDADRQCREAAEDWVRQQTETSRRTAFDLAQASGFGTPEAWAAVAAFWSGGSMAPEGQPAVPPAPHLTGTAVAGVSCSCRRCAAMSTRRDARLHRFLESGRNIAAGGPGRLPAETGVIYDRPRGRESADAMQLTMTVLRCPDAVVPETRNVSGGEYSVGRGPGVDWILPDPERLLSKRHFALAFRGGGWQLADTSTNGTFINREENAIGGGDIRSLRDGDRLRVGAYEIEVRLTEDAVARPVAAPATARSTIHSDGPVRGDRARRAIRSTSRITRACASPSAQLAA